MATQIDLSIIIPVYNSSSFLEERLHHLVDFLRKRPLAFEVIAVDDGSTDGSADLLRRLEWPELEVVELDTNGGKFAAIRRGMKNARGQCRIFTDADVPYELTILPHMQQLVRERGMHIVVGDRTLPGSRYTADLGLIRRVVSDAFTLFIRLLVTGGLVDTQCGVKAFRADVADALFSVTRENGFAGDVELLYVALKHNLDIKRIPARLAYQGASTVRPARDGLRMLASLIAIRARHRGGAYDSPALHALGHDRYWENQPPEKKAR